MQCLLKSKIRATKSRDIKRYASLKSLEVTIIFYARFFWRVTKRRDARKKKWEKLPSPVKSEILPLKKKGQHTALVPSQLFTWCRNKAYSFPLKEGVRKKKQEDFKRVVIFSFVGCPFFLRASLFFSCLP